MLMPEDFMSEYANLDIDELFLLLFACLNRSFDTVSANSFFAPSEGPPVKAVAEVRILARNDFLLGLFVDERTRVLLLAVRLWSSLACFARRRASFLTSVGVKISPTVGRLGLAGLSFAKPSTFGLLFAAGALAILFSNSPVEASYLRPFISITLLFLITQLPFSFRFVIGVYILGRTVLEAQANL